MNILLSGSEGFIGSHVYDRLTTLGHTVIGVDNMDVRVHPLGTVPERTQRVMHYGQTMYQDVCWADVIIHLAAQVSVADSMENSRLYLHQNTSEMYEFMHTIRMAAESGHTWERLVVASSSSVYGNVPLPMIEDGPTRPNNVYGLTKFDQERLALMWGEAYGIPTVALRFFNVYGPRQARHNIHTGVLANFTRMLLNGERPTVTQDGMQFRDLTYVDDVAWAVTEVALAESYDHHIYNVCTGIPTTMYDAAWMLAQALGKDLRPKVTGEYRRGDQANVLGSYARLFEEFGWVPRPYGDGVEDYAKKIRDNTPSEDDALWQYR